MTFSKKYLTPHVLFEELTFEEYCAKLPKLYLKPEVPVDVHKNFEIIEKLLAHSYYEYKFIDEAYAKALYTLEMAVNLRHKEYFKGHKRTTFNQLITDLYDLNLFDSSLDELKDVKEMRNYYAHPKRHSFAGFAVWNRIEAISRLINEMYEDVDLRIQRRKLKDEFIESQRKYNLDKSVVMEIKGKPTILYSLTLLFINNKYENPAYLFACTPLFDLEIGESRSHKVPFVFKSKLVSTKISDNAIEGISFSAKQKVKFSSVNNNKDFYDEFTKWNDEYSNIPDNTIFELSMNLNVPEILIQEIREFQQMDTRL